jgi:hypothetical protein
MVLEPFIEFFFDLSQIRTKKCALRAGPFMNQNDSRSDPARG